MRLIPPSHIEIRALLNHRLPVDPAPALADWQTLVAGTSPLWLPIHSAARELLRSMLNHVNLEILKRARPPHSTFNFSSASIGNLFLTGARLFTGSFESAIYLLALVCGIPDHAAVIPAINSNFSHHISAGLENGDIITGQNAISHPSGPSALPGRNERDERSENDLVNADESGEEDTADGEHDAEDANLPGTLPSLRTPNIHFTKPPALNVSITPPAPLIDSPTSTPPPSRQEHHPSAVHQDHALPSPISRIWYINPYGQEIRPRASPKAVSAICSAAAIIYSIGSLYTSIVPSMILRGIGTALVAASNVTRRKVLVLNGSSDRETAGMGAAEYVAAIARAGEESRGWRASKSDRGKGPDGGIDKGIWKSYVTHVVYMEGEGVPEVNKEELASAGVECVRCWGKKADDGVWRYDLKGLVGALEAALGKGRDGLKSRRNTLEG